MYYGDFLPGQAIRFEFTTLSTDGSGAAAALGSGDLCVYKDGNTACSTAGLTLTATFDSVVGFNQVAILTTADGTFYSAGSDFVAMLTTGYVGAVSLRGYAVAKFSIANRLAGRAVYAGTITGSSTTTSLVDSGLTQSSTDFWKGRIVVFYTGSLAGQATDITAFTPASDTLTVTALTDAPATGDRFVII